MEWNDGDFPIVETTRGPVRGRTCLDYHGNPYYSFVRVPYAKGPSGPTRFCQASRALLDPWTEPLDCTFDIETQSPPPFTEENCLYANIYTPVLPSPTTVYAHFKPIMVFIPGENATLSHRTDLEKYGPQHFMMEGIVLIVLSYRSGILGFGKVQDRNLRKEGGVQGYVGYGDIVHFFKWLRFENRRFGGKDNSAVPFGQGSGAALIVESLYSGERGGFPGVNKVIVQSSNSYTWIGPDNINLKEYAMFAGLATADHTEEQVLAMLRRMPVEELVKYEQEYLKRAKFRTLSFRFMTRLKKIYDFGGVYAAVMMGFNSNEGIMDKILVDKIDKDVQDVEKLLQFIWFPDESRLGSALRAELVPKIKEYYYGTDGPSRTKFMQIVSDLNHNIESLVTARNLPRSMQLTTRIWLYRFAVDGQLNLVKKMHNATKYSGACFGDELGYLFKVPGLPAVERGSLEDVTIKRMVKLWANFARSGCPNPNPRCPTLGDTGWKTLANSNMDLQRFSYMNIDRELTFGRIQPEIVRLSFWSKMLGDRVRKTPKRKRNE